MSTYYLVPAPYLGALPASGTIETYQTGTSTPLATAQDSLGTAHPTTVNIDTSGRAPAIYLPDRDSSHVVQKFKLIIKDSAGATVATVDPVQVPGISPTSLDGVTNLSDFADLAAAVTSIGATVSTLLIGAAAPVTANLTVPSNIELVFTGAGQIQPNGGVTVTLDRQPNAAYKQIFGGSGSVVFGTSAATDPVPAVWWGAVTDGTAVDTPAVVSARQAGSGVLVTSGTHRMGAATLNDLVGVSPRVSLLAFDASASFTMSDPESSVNSVKLTGNAPAFISLAGGLVDWKIVQSIIDNGTGSQAIDINSAGVLRGLIALCKVKTQSACVLVNTSAAGSGELIIVGNNMNTDFGDAIEINVPGITSDFYAILGNILRGGPNGSSTSSGFAIGLANPAFVASVGNVIPEARQQIFHAEDGASGCNFVGNVGLSNDIGANVIQNAAGTTKPVPIIGNAMEQKAGATGSTKTGINHVNDASGSVTGSPIVGNWLKDFSTGINTGLTGPGIVTANVIEGSSVSLQANKGILRGENVVKTPATLFKTGAEAIGPYFVCDSKPTAWFDNSTHSEGAFMRGFSFLDTVAFSAPSTLYTTLCPLGGGDLLTGRITCHAKALGVNRAVYIAQLNWDGTTLTVTDSVEKVAGVFTSPQVRVNAGNLEFGHFSGSALTSNLLIDFDGMYYGA